MNPREQAWSLAGALFVTSPAQEVEACCRARVYRVQAFRLERVALAGGLPFEVEAETFRAAELNLVRRLELYQGGRATPVSINLRFFVREGTWTLA